MSTEGDTVATKDLTLETFPGTVAEGIVLVDFWAAWCGPCRMFAPIYEAASLAHPGIVFGKVDTEAQQELASAFRITSIPTLMGFRDGILLFSQPGALPAQSLQSVIDQISALDMDEVLAQIAGAEAVGAGN